MNFQYSWLLLLLAPLPFLAWAFYRRSSSAMERKRFPLLFLSLVSLVIALANPYWSFAPERQLVRGVDFIVMIDVSQSMFCYEGTVRRIDRAAGLLRGLLPNFAGSEAGIIYFAGDAQIGCPLTPDLNALPLFLDSMTPEMTAKPGTRAAPLKAALEEMLGEAQDSSRKRAALLFTDGEFQDGSGTLTRWLKNRSDLTLFTFQCGTTRSPVPKFDLSGPYKGAFSDPNPRTLLEMAAAGGGSFHDLTKSQASSIETSFLSDVREMIAAGRPVPDYQFLPFLIFAAFLLIAYQIFPGLFPFFLKPRAVLASVLLLLIVSIAMKDAGESVNLFSGALKDAKAKRYDEAMKKLRTLQKEGASEEVEIAIGNLFFAQEKWDESIRHYRDALKRNRGNSRARWNWEVALKRKSNQSQPPETPPPPQQAPQSLPQETNALLKYFDQLEKEQLRETNKQKDNTDEFAW